MIKNNIKTFGSALETSIKNYPDDLSLTLKLIANWHKIALDYHKSTKPMRLYLKQKMLIIAASPAQSMNIQYSIPALIDSVNKFFNRKLIEKIIVRNQLNGVE